MEFAFDVGGSHDRTYRSLLERKLDEVGHTPGISYNGLTGSTTNRYSARKKVIRTDSADKGLMRHDPTHFTSAIAQSKKETRSLRDQLAKMEKRALLAEERAKDASVMERRTRAALDARDKQVSSMRLRLDKMSSDMQASEGKRMEMQAYVSKLERKLASAGAKQGAFAVRNASPSKKVEKESFLDAIAELQGENARLHQALEEVEEALDVEAKRLDLADGGALLESLRTRRLLETAELALKREATNRQNMETKLKKAVIRAQVAEDERKDRDRAEASLLARCETQERDNQALLDYIEEMSTGQLSPMSSKRMSVRMHANINNIKENLNDSNHVDGARAISDTPVSAKDSQSFTSGARSSSMQRLSSSRSQSSARNGQALRALARSLDVADEISSDDEPSPNVSPRRPFPKSPSSPERRVSQDALRSRLDRITHLKKQLGRAKRL